MVPIFAQHRSSLNGAAAAWMACTWFVTPGLARAHGGDALAELAAWMMAAPALAFALACLACALLLGHSAHHSERAAGFRDLAATAGLSVGGVALLFMVRALAPVSVGLAASLAAIAAVGLLVAIRAFVGPRDGRSDGTVDHEALVSWLSEREAMRSPGLELAVRGLRAWTETDARIGVLVFVVAMFFSSWKASGHSAWLWPFVALLPFALLRWVFRDRVVSFTDGTIVLSRPWDGVHEVPPSDVLAWGRSRRRAWLLVRIETREAFVAMPPESHRPRL